MAEHKILTILRHAKAEAGHAMQDDHDRALNERGQAVATALGNHLEKRGVQFDLVLCSTAKRTRQTLELLHLSGEPQVEFAQRLYLASANEILQVLATVPDSVSRVLLVGHNPGLHQLCLKLAKQGEEEMIDIMSLKYPTCSMASFECGAHWEKIAQANSMLLDFMTPKALMMQEED